MIVATGTTNGQVLGAGEGLLRWACLARRGMLHSECEGVDVWELEPAATLTGRGRDGVGEIWFVVAGTGRLDSGRTVRPDSAIIRPPQAAVEELTAETAMTVVTVSVLGRETSRLLPTRTPELATA
jgi:hypothetical protein